MITAAQARIDNARRRLAQLEREEPPCECNRVGDLDYSADCDLHNYNSKWRTELRAAEAEAK
jgi:hypothetical protein